VRSAARSVPPRGHHRPRRRGNAAQEVLCFGSRTLPLYLPHPPCRIPRFRLYGFGRYSPHMTLRRATSPTKQTPTAKTEIATPVVMFPSCLLRFGVPRLDHDMVEAIGEGEVLAALASEGGALRTPHRKRPTEYRPFPALLAGQYDPFRRTVHSAQPPAFLCLQRPTSHVDGSGARSTSLELMRVVWFIPAVRKSEV
jgi:hypothetical protein